MPERHVRIVGTGAYLPGEPIKFLDIEKVLGEFEGMSPDFQKWYKRTRRVMQQILGMENYYYAIDPETGERSDTCAGLSAKAARPALSMANMDPNDIELLIYGSSSMDHFICPPTSTLLQQELGIERCAEMSVHSNCTATYKALQIAYDMIRVGRYDTAMICSSNLISTALRTEYFNLAKLERNHAILRWFLCDGGGALVLKAEEEWVPGVYVVDTYLESVGCHLPPHMYAVTGCSTKGPKSDYELGNHHVVQDFRQVSQIGPKIGVEGLERFFEQCKAQFGEKGFQERLGAMTHFLANVPTMHMIDLAYDDLMPVAKKFGLEPNIDIYYSTTNKLGYTGPVAILLTLDRLLRTEILNDRATIMSFVTESSKWMNAGFILENRA